MKKTLCLYFQVHQPDRLRLYRFFDICRDSHYYDDFTNRTILKRVAERCYLPANKLLLDLIERHKGAFRVSFSISGSVLEQFERYVPEVIDSFKALADTGCVEFLCETYYHSLASLVSGKEFASQVEKHRRTVKEYFGKEPSAFRNTELIYSDDIASMLYDLGFKTVLTEGAKHILGWKSPDFVYNSPKHPDQKLLLRNFALSDDIAFRFSDTSWQGWPVTADKFVSWLGDDTGNGEIVNLFMDYETFGEHQQAQTGIFDFLSWLPQTVVSSGNFEFLTPSQAVVKHESVGSLEVRHPISWADEERDTSAWLGNELQNEAFSKLYALEEKMADIKDMSIRSDFGKLQESDHFYYMCTKFFSDGAVHKYFNPYDTPYEAFINYMNVLSDFIARVDEAVSTASSEAGPTPVKTRRRLA